MSNGAAHFAGMIACNSSIKFDNLSCGCFKTKTGLWILDSGTTHHITSNKSHLSNITILPYPLLVDLLNGYKVKVTEVRSMKLAPVIILHKVYFIPSFKYNLVSIKSLVAHLKCISIFSDSSCMLQAISIKRPLDVGRAHDGLYFLCSTCLQKMSLATNQSVSSLATTQSISFSSNVIGCQCKNLYHSCSCTH